MKRVPLRRKTPMKQRSRKTIERQPERTAMRERVLARAGHRCQMAALIPEIPCGGRLEVDERQSRKAMPGSQYDDEQGQVGCSAHHRWKTDNPTLATERGLTVRSTFERDGLARRLSE